MHFVFPTTKKYEENSLINNSMLLPEEGQLPGKNIVSDLSSPPDFSHKPVVQVLQDATGKTHYLVKYDVTRDPLGRCRTKKRTKIV
jgi:hypothetical protein